MLLLGQGFFYLVFFFFFVIQMIFLVFLVNGLELNINH